MSVKRWGATPEMWQRVGRGELYKHILPVVSNLEAEIAPISRMKALGKTPSVYNSERKVVGISKWTEKEPSQTEFDRWTKEPDYGICLQTRSLIKALDIDCEDVAVAKELFDAFPSLYGSTCRFRENSNKMLIPIAIDTDEVLTKRIARIGDGLIEFLATGQQFVLDGTHSSGVRYQLNGPLDDIARMDLEEFEQIWSYIEMFMADSVSSRGTRRRGADTNLDKSDDVSDFLIENGLSYGVGSDGQIFIKCPFDDEHSSGVPGDTSTAYFPAGTGGYERGHFVCLHASCGERTDMDYIDALGIREKEATAIQVTKEDIAYVEKKHPKAPEVNDKLKNVEFHDVVEKTGLPKPTLMNITIALKHSLTGFQPKYDNFREEILFFYNDTEYLPPSDEIYIKMRTKLEAVYGFGEISKEKMRDAVMCYARENEIDTAVMWLNSLKWDGVPRIHKFFKDYLCCEDVPRYTEAVSRYFWTGAAGRILDPGCKCDMTPVLKSDEGMGKSSSIEAIAPSAEQFVEIDLGERDSDLSRKICGKMVAEIAELRGLRTRDAESILAFMTRRFEEWVPKYQEHTKKRPRRLMFIATTNDPEYLESGRTNRRWLPLNVVDIADPSVIERDRDQLWAEAAIVFKQNGVMYSEAEKLAHKQRDEVRIHHAWEEIVANWIDTATTITDEGDEIPVAKSEFVTISEIGTRALGFKPMQINQSHKVTISNVLKTLGFVPARRRVSGEQLRVWLFPDKVR